MENASDAALFDLCAGKISCALFKNLNFAFAGPGTLRLMQVRAGPKLGHSNLQEFVLSPILGVN